MILIRQLLEPRDEFRDERDMGDRVCFCVDAVGQVGVGAGVLDEGFEGGDEVVLVRVGEVGVGDGVDGAGDVV